MEIGVLSLRMWKALVVVGEGGLELFVLLLPGLEDVELLVT